MKSRCKIIVGLLLGVMFGASVACANPSTKMTEMEADLKAVQRLIDDARQNMPPETTAGVSHLVPLMAGWLADLKPSSMTFDKADMPARRPLSDGKLGTMPIGLALVQLNSLSGNSASSLPKLDSTLSVLVIREGRLTLKQLVKQAADQFPDALESSGNIITARWPLFISSDAELLLESGDNLVLSGTGASFILNLGVLIAEGATVSAGSGAPDTVPDYRPFIATISSGALQSYQSKYSGLGFGGADGAKGMIISGAQMSPQIHKSVLIENVFDDVGGVVISNTSNLIVSENSFLASRLFDLKISEIVDANITANVFNRTKGIFSIKVGLRSADVRIENNVIIEGSGDGIIIEGGSANLTVTKNLISELRHDAVTIDRASCLSVANNVAFGNRGNGIQVRRSADISLENNQLIGNRKAGIFLKAQSKSAITTILGNIFIANGSGIHGQASSQIDIANNDFTGQLPVLVAGDLSASLKLFLDKNQHSARHLISATSWASSSDKTGRVSTAKPVIPCQIGN